MSSQISLIALAGRTNVGKSSLFNSLLGFKRSLVDDRHGLTRDCIVESLVLGEQNASLVDTGGLDRTGSLDQLEQEFLKHTWAFLREVDVCVFVLDASVGLLDADISLFQKIKDITRKIVIVWNKADLDLPFALEQAARLGDYQSFLVSAKNNEGIEELKNFLKNQCASQSSQPPVHIVEQSFGFFGRPNVGKSSLSNALAREKKFLVSEVAGTTRDFNSTYLTINDRELRLYDTAGVLPNVHRHPAMLERMVYYRTLVALKQVAVGVLVIDAKDGLTQADLKVLSLLESYRRGLIILINKWDLIDSSEQMRLKEYLEYALKGYSYCPMIPVSAKTGYNLQGFKSALIAVLDSFVAQIATGPLNTALEKIVEKHQPPLMGKHRIKLRYAHVVDMKPLTILIHGTQLQKLPDHYKKYLKNAFCEYFSLVGIPLKLDFKNSNNPYANKK